MARNSVRWRQLQIQVVLVATALAVAVIGTGYGCGGSDDTTPAPLPSADILTPSASPSPSPSVSASTPTPEPSPSPLATPSIVFPLTPSPIPAPGWEAGATLRAGSFDLGLGGEGAAGQRSAEVAAEPGPALLAGDWNATGFALSLKDYRDESHAYSFQLNCYDSADSGKKLEAGREYPIGADGYSNFAPFYTQLAPGTPELLAKHGFVAYYLSYAVSGKVRVVAASEHKLHLELDAVQFAFVPNALGVYGPTVTVSGTILLRR